MTATDITAAIPETPAKEERPASWRLIFSVICVVVPVAIWFAPLAVPHAAKGAMAVTSFMILAWMTNVMEYGAAGVIGCTLFWALGVAKFETAFSGFVSDTPWFLVGAILLGEAANKKCFRRGEGLQYRPRDLSLRHLYRGDFR
jgi:di/tricarboxylate transporter